jgi:hypothetical protein
MGKATKLLWSLSGVVVSECWVSRIDRLHAEDRPGADMM